MYVLVDSTNSNLKFAIFTLSNAFSWPWRKYNFMLQERAQANINRPRQRRLALVERENAW